MAKRDHGNRSRHVDSEGDRIGHHHQRQRDQDLQVVLVDRLDRPIGEVAGEETEHGPAKGLADEQPGHLEGPERRAAITAGGDRHQDGEHHHADPVVEQALAGDLGLQRLRHLDGLEDAEHRHRVGRRDQRPEHQAIEKRDIQADQPNYPIGRRADQGGGDQHPHGGQRADRPLALDQVVEVHVQRTGEQEEAQHAVHQRLGQVEAGQRLAHRRLEPERRDQGIEGDHAHRRDQRDDHQADGVRQPEPAVVQVPERRRQGQHDGGHVEQGGVVVMRWGSTYHDLTASPAGQRRLGVEKPLDTLATRRQSGTKNEH
jgi:hypothetical protein